MRLLRVRGKRTLRRIWDDDLYIPPDEAEVPVNIAGLPSYEIDLHADERECEQPAPISQWTE
jgi:hypothetical protein